MTGSLVAVSSGLLGCFLILRKMAMVGDAISHAVLPGIVIAYLLSGNTMGIFPLIGAAIVGVFASVMIEWLSRKAKLQSDASIGLTFTLLFAIGVILASYFAADVDIDQECILYGEIAYVPLDQFMGDDGTLYGPRAFWILWGVLCLVTVFITAGYKGLVITTFDPAYAASVGISTAFWHYGLMGAVSLTTVVSFESVGAVLVLAFLVVLPATAYLLTDKLRSMLFIVILLGIITSGLGYYLAVAFDGSIAGAMTIVAGALFLLTFLFSPSQGLFTKGGESGAFSNQVFDKAREYSTRNKAD